MLLPQSPKQLFIQQNNEEAARKSLKFYYGENREKEIDEAIREMVSENKQAKKEKSSTLDIIQHPSHRFSLFLVFICSLVPVFSGLNIKSQYLGELLISYGLSQSDSTLAILTISAISLPISLTAPLMIEKYGRRPIFVILTWLCALEWIGFAIPEAMNDFGVRWDSRWIVACVSAILGQSAVNLGMLVMAPIMISELCPQNIRAKVSQLTQVPPIAIAVLEVFMFPELKSHFGFSMFLFLASCCAALAMILHTQMLETAGLAVDEIVSRLGGETTLTRSNTSVGWMHYGSLWEKEPSTVGRKNTYYAKPEQIQVF
uniref:Major facilitator superfamily (MFS) profile domain-containing protein n=1 Tax=Caenorhabditis japonica TaxID=281687 RepID=A0A8R1E2C4_CAEJA